MIPTVQRHPWTGHSAWYVAVFKLQSVAEEAETTAFLETIHAKGSLRRFPIPKNSLRFKSDCQIAHVMAISQS
jgi:hypothetical protein